MILFLTFAFFWCSSAARDSPEVTTSLGVVKGSVLQSRNGREFFSFSRIPFAKPPLGSLRFKDPVRPEPWNGVLDGTKFNPPCYQILTNAPIGSEDCLYLNVYTPKMNESLPVMFYIFGGGWRIGMPGPPNVARYFMDEDVVLVMINYRLGALGFLSTEDDVIPGNMGLKDMAVALEWTKREIRNFGGNPDLITAFGLSAGASSAHYLCSVPRTKALLKGCISESGVGGSHWSLAKPGASKKKAKIVSEALGCKPENLLPCLQSKTAEEITKTQSLLRFWVDEPLILHGPLLEKNHDGAILTEWPVQDSNFPWLTGVVSREGLFKSIVISNLEDSPLIADFLNKKEEYIQRMLNLPQGSERAARNVVEKYFPGNDVADGIEKLYTDGYFVYPALHELRNHRGPKYFYVFNITGGMSIWEAVFKRKIDTSSGVAHGDEQSFFFDLSYLLANKTPRPDLDRLSQEVVKLWVNFAKHQNPTEGGSQPEWPQFGDNGQYLYMSNEKFETREYAMKEIVQFWDDVFAHHNRLTHSDGPGSDEL